MRFRPFQNRKRPPWTQGFLEKKLPSLRCLESRSSSSGTSLVLSMLGDFRKSKTEPHCAGAFASCLKMSPTPLMYSVKKKVTMNNPFMFTRPRIQHPLSLRKWSRPLTPVLGIIGVQGPKSWPKSRALRSKAAVSERHRVPILFYFAMGRSHVQAGTVFPELPGNGLLWRSPGLQWYGAGLRGPASFAGLRLRCAGSEIPC